MVSKKSHRCDAFGAIGTLAPASGNAARSKADICNAKRHVRFTPDNGYPHLATFAKKLGGENSHRVADWKID